MSAQSVPHPPPTLTPERLRELARAGSVAASTAFAQFLGRTLLACEPRLEVRHAAVDGEFAGGVFFSTEGDFQGEVALLLSRATWEAVDADGARGSSLLLELANVVASQILSGVADAVGGRILLSIPSLVADGAARELAWRAGPAPAPERVACEFSDPAGPLRALLVVLPAASTPHHASDTVGG